MNTEEAKKALSEGKKISHISYGANEYLMINEHGTIVDEEGKPFNYEWFYFSDKKNNNGWIIYGEIPNNIDQKNYDLVIETELSELIATTNIAILQGYKTSGGPLYVDGSFIQAIVLT